MARKKNPRAPSMSLEDAISKAQKVYDKERRHASPVDVVAQNIGYKSANNGAALGALASLRYYGLLERPKEGHLAASKDVETYLYAPSDSLRRQLLTKWLRTPTVFSELLDKYEDGLPSDATLRFDLINQGFSPTSAETVIAIFKKSADFAGIYRTDASELATAGPCPIEQQHSNDQLPVQAIRAEATERNAVVGHPLVGDGEDDRIPVRLSDGRKAWLVIPSQFFEADKERLKAQIDLLLTDDG